MYKNYHLRLKTENYDKIQKIAELSNRSLNKQIETAIETYLADYEKINGKVETHEKKEK